jgi:hypothetical protein
MAALRALSIRPPFAKLILCGSNLLRVLRVAVVNPNLSPYAGDA